MTQKARKPMDQAELLALPTVVDIATAGRAFDIGRNRAFSMARDGEFPCRVLRIGSRYRVTRAELFRALGITDAHEPAESQGGAA